MKPELGIPNANPDADPNLAAEIANRSFFRTGESLSMEQIGSAEDPQELFQGLREVLAHLEDGNVPGSLEDRYGATRIFGMIYERAKLLKHTPEELVKKGWIKNYDEQTGEAIPKNRKYAPLALSIVETPVPIIDDKGNQRGMTVDVKYNFGKEKERQELAGAYERAILEMEARAIIGDHIGIRLNLDYRDNLEGLVELMHGGRVPKFKVDHLKALFNMPDINEMSVNSENRKLGDQLEEALFLNLLMLNSGTKTQIETLLSRPGSKYLVAKMAKEQGINYDEWVSKYIGEVKQWKDDGVRELDSYKIEPRGLVTNLANIPSFVGEPGEPIGVNKENNFIENIIGGACGSVEASWLAASLMKVTGTYSSDGRVALPNGTSQLTLGEGRFISQDDTGKFLAYLWDMKEGLKGRPSGLKNMIGKIPDMAMNLFDWAQVEIVLPNGTKAKRSIWDAWLGTPEGVEIKDILTMQATSKKTVTEPYHRLGDLDFGSLEPGFHGTFTTMQWLMGRERDGVMTSAKQIEFKTDDFKLNALKKMWKYIGIVFNPIVLTKGSVHLYDVKNIGLIQKNYFRNLMLARINSYSFTTSILNDTIPMLEADYKDAGIPTPLLVKAFVKEVLSGNPNNEEEIKKHYMDAYAILTKQGRTTLGPVTIKTAGTTTDRFDILSEKFEPENEQEKLLMSFVGKVTGKNSF